VQEEGEETATAKRLPDNARGLQTGKRQKKQPHSMTLARIEALWRSFWTAPVFSGAFSFDAA